MSRNTFTVLVIGDNPDESMKKYDKNMEVEPYKLFNKHEDINVVRDSYLKEIKTAIDSMPQGNDKGRAIEFYEMLKEKTIDEFFKYIIAGYIFDEKTGDVLSTENKDGKWDNYTVGGDNCQKFILKDGTVSSQALLSEIDWESIVKQDSDKYGLAWDLVVDGKEPKTDLEHTIFNNMKNSKSYFNLFKNKAEYIGYCCLFKTTSVINEENEWCDMPKNYSEIDWVLNYYSRFIEPLKSDVLLTIYEFLI